MNNQHKRGAISLKKWCNSNNSHLLEEWDYENNNISPDEIPYGSATKVMWICSKKHRWEASINNRTKGSSCPFCSNKRTLIGFNDLETVKPEIAKEWCYELNTDMRPCDYRPFDHKNVYWKCSLGHIWKATIANRSNGSGCPFCVGRKLLKGYNDLKTMVPELVKEWHPTLNGNMDPSDFTINSFTNVWWICKNKHVWKKTIRLRVNGTGCPFCNNKKIIPGDNDLATINPELANEWNYEKNDITPSEVSAKSNKKVWWVCKYGHEWEATINSRSNNIGCPICSQGRNTSFNEKAIFICLKKSFPNEIVVPNYKGMRNVGITELDIFIPRLRIGIEYDGPLHKPEKDFQKNKACESNNIKLIRIKELSQYRDYSNEISPFISLSRNPKINDVKNAIEMLIRYIAKEANIESFQINNDIEEYRSEINELLNVNPELSLSKCNPELAKEWHPTKNGTLTPDDVSYGSSLEVWWICKLNHSWPAKINNRAKTGCPYCNNKKLLPGYNDLETKYPKLAKEWHPTKNLPLKPSEVFSTSKETVWWMCELGHEWRATIVDRKRGSKCHICTNKVILPGYNDFASHCQDLVCQWVYEKNKPELPTTVYYKSGKKYWWVCPQGHLWQDTIKRRFEGHGCPICTINKKI